MKQSKKDLFLINNIIIKMVFQTLNELKWKGSLDRCEVVFIHRGAKDNRKTISGKRITEVKKSHFYYSDDNRETYIPNHRVLEIKLEGTVIWRKRFPKKE